MTLKSDAEIEVLIAVTTYGGFNPEPGDPRTQVKRLMAAAFALTRFISP
jgi:hypothetical protein